MKLSPKINLLGRLSLRAGIISILLYGSAHAANLKPETVSAWNAYIDAAKARMQDHLEPQNHFLWVDDNPELASRVRNGEVIISSVGKQNPKKVPSGLIHDWIGAAFLPDTTVADVLSTVRDYDHYKDFYQPTVMESRAIKAQGTDDQFSMLLMNKSVVIKTALDSQYDVSYVRVTQKRWYSVSQTTRIQEVEKYGTPEEHLLPVDEGAGLIWRLMSISRFEERDGGVYVELEAIALSRDIPASMHWFVAPIVRRVSKNSLLISLQQTEQAVRRNGELAERLSKHESSAIQADAGNAQAVPLRTSLH